MRNAIRSSHASLLMQPLVPLVFNCHPYIPLHLEEMIFYTCFTDFWLCRMHHLEYRCKKDFCIYYTCNYRFLLHYRPSLFGSLRPLRGVVVSCGSHQLDRSRSPKMHCIHLLVPSFTCSRMLCSMQGSNSDRTVTLRLRSRRAHYPKWRRLLLISEIFSVHSRCKYVVIPPTLL